MGTESIRRTRVVTFVVHLFLALGVGLAFLLFLPVFARVAVYAVGSFVTLVIAFWLVLQAMLTRENRVQHRQKLLSAYGESASRALFLSGGEVFQVREAPDGTDLPAEPIESLDFLRHAMYRQRQTDAVMIEWLQSEGGVRRSDYWLLVAALWGFVLTAFTGAPVP